MRIVLLLDGMVLEVLYKAQIYSFILKKSRELSIDSLLYTVPSGTHLPYKSSTTCIFMCEGMTFNVLEHIPYYYML